MTLKTLKNIKLSETFIAIHKIELGWSSDEKYKIESSDGTSYVLRLSDIKLYETKKKEFEVIKRFSALGFLMSMPIDFGMLEDENYCYMLLTFIEGESLEDALPKLDEMTQYQLGLKTGFILKKIHSLEVPSDMIEERDIKEKKLRQLSLYESSSLRMPGDEKVIDFIKAHIDWIGKEKSTFQHGDFHPGNLILTKDMAIGVIDFNRWDINDPYEEFYKLECFSSSISIPFSKGQLDAYFDEEIPDAFWKALSVYSAHVALYSIKWAEKFGEEDILHMKELYHMIMRHYDYFERYIPNWYEKKV